MEGGIEPCGYGGKGVPGRCKGPGQEVLLVIPWKSWCCWSAVSERGHRWSASSQEVGRESLVAVLSVALSLGLFQAGRAMRR